MEYIMTKLLLISLFSLGLAACTQQTAPPTEEANQIGETAPPETAVTNQEIASPAASAQIYTLTQVAEHNQAPDDCWLAISGKVYDVSGFGEKHPGSEAVYQGCGQDATPLFETRPMGSGTPHSDKARGFLPNFYIGDLAN